MRLWMRLSAWLCLSLMLWTVAAESTHHHPSQTEAASCSICLVAHSASPAIICSQATPVFATISLLREEAVLAKARLDFSELGIRGPPIL
ncbi:MAG: hypothetical protein ACLQBK_03820 [Candidatus Sulfotelmatobacter sp.]